MGEVTVHGSPALAAAHSNVRPLPIAGACTQDLKIIATAGGPVLHMLRPDSPLFSNFGELYFSEVTPGAVKAWKKHSRQTQHFAVPTGNIVVVLYDDREASPSRGTVCEVQLGRPGNYHLLRIPPEVWYGFAALGSQAALVCNCADLPHDPTESIRKDMHDPAIPYRWQSHEE